MDLLSLPEEVIEGHLLPFLKWNDLLRFRRVCQRTKDIVDLYIKVHPYLAPEIEINEREKNFEAFLKMGISTTKFFLNNVSGTKFYQTYSKDITKFLQTCGPLVQQLRVTQLFACLSGKEWEFLEFLVNLKHFEVGYIGLGVDKPAISELQMQQALITMIDMAEQDSRFVLNEPPFPKVFNQLKVLKIGQRPNELLPNIIELGVVHYKNTSEVEQIALPFNSNLFTNVSRFQHMDVRKTALYYSFNLLKNVIQDRATSNLPKSNLQLIDFVSYHDEEDVWEMEFFGSEPFLKLCSVCLEHNVKLMNVGAFWFVKIVQHGNRHLSELGKTVKSLVNLHPCIFTLDMPNLEKITIKATSRSFAGQNWTRERPYWPALKSLDITVDSVTTMGTEWSADLTPSRSMIGGQHLFRFFFKDIRRRALTELNINFALVRGNGAIPIPKTEDITSSCPNLKKLTFVNWPGKNMALMKLFDGLRGLEEISLECCKEVGNVAFVGTEMRSPVFLKLSKLRKLSLKGLDQMPKITDTLFNMVIRHLELVHFELTSDTPMRSVTPRGILSLLEGRFATSIVKFPFCGWSLENVTAMEFQKLERKFRCYDML